VINPSKSEVAELDESTEVSFLPMELIGEDGSLDLSELRQIKQVYQGFTYCRDHDVIVAKITPCFENGKGALALGLRNGIGFGTTELHVMRPKAQVDERFLFYITRSSWFRSAGERMMFGAGGQKRVPEDFIKDFVLPLPAKDEQRRIAAFLDAKLGRLDELVRKKERQLALLVEKRQALISHAVTCGLNPNAPTKTSGLLWFDAIPTHWNPIRLKFLARIRYGLGQPPKSRPEGVPMIRATNVDAGRITPENMALIDPTEVPESRDATLTAGEIIVVRSGAYTCDSAIIPPKYEGAIAGYDLVVRVKRAEAEFVAFSLLSGPVRDAQLKPCSLRAAQPHLNAEELGDCVLAVPPRDEQQAIVGFLKTATVNLERVRGTIDVQLEKLRDYRQALITAAVTGKIAIPEAAA
jgi:type I restriction enzyme S subunit